MGHAKTQLGKAIKTVGLPAAIPVVVGVLLLVSALLCFASVNGWITANQVPWLAPFTSLPTAIIVWAFWHILSQRP